MATQSTIKPALQLQLWDSQARQYVPVPDAPPDPDTARQLAHGRGWRIALPSRELKPPRYRRASRYGGYSRTVFAVQREYLTWATARGLTSITLWEGSSPWSKQQGSKERDRFTDIKYVNDEDFAEAQEVTALAA